MARHTIDMPLLSQTTGYSFVAVVLLESKPFFLTSIFPTFLLSNTALHLLTVPHLL